MREFIARHRADVIGTLSGFDRLVFRGTLRSITFPDGFRRYLQRNGVLLKDYGAHVAKVSREVKTASVAVAEATGRPIEYLRSNAKSKEEIARAIAARDQVQQGLICVLTAVEPCFTFEIFRNRAEKKLELQLRQRKCLFLYHYSIHPQFGFMNARIQTWFPFQIQVCLNGREWLQRELTQRRLSHTAVGNCLVAADDWAQVQRVMNEQLRTNWPATLDQIAEQLNPIHAQVFAHDPVRYYWTTYQSEWAIDVVFRQPDVLRKLYPRLVHHGMTTFASGDVMRFLGKPTLLSGDVPATFKGEIRSDLKHRQEGVRIKHLLNGNSVKLYDKAFTDIGTVLRAETTIQNGDDLRVYRAKEGDSDGPKSWRILRRGIADLHRRAELSRKAAERYLNAYAAVDATETLEQLVGRIQGPTLWRGRRVRALRPFGDDNPLLTILSRGEFTLNGFRNRDLQSLLFPTPPSTAADQRRRSALISRKLRMLRAHGLITKVEKTHRYQLTIAGRKTITAILTALRASVHQLTSLAA